MEVYGLYTAHPNQRAYVSYTIQQRFKPNSASGAIKMSDKHQPIQQGKDTNFKFWGELR